MDATWQMHLGSRRITSAKSPTSSVDIQVEAIMDRLIKWHQPNGGTNMQAYSFPLSLSTAWLDTVRADI
ncbi:hypothetical protein BM1_08396 [Bipolaris maydis]|nr:hypothetical protein BM1_08396 [Bipolaris maydis]